MRYFEDDSHTIPDYIRKMPLEQLRKEIARLEEKERKKRALRAKKTAAHPQNA
jgi:hypothetical protein